MEGFPQQESVERGADWRELREGAPHEAESLISAISGFSHMEVPEQIASLDALLGDLVRENRNRYVYREVSLIRARIEEEERHKVVMERLGVAQ